MTNLWDAADAQIRVGEADVNKQKNQVKMDVRKAFFGLQLARDSLALLSDATDKLDKAVAHLEQEVKNGQRRRDRPLQIEDVSLRARRAQGRSCIATMRSLRARCDF